MGAEEGRLVGDLPRQPQRAHLVVDGEAVATLDLDGRGTEGPHLGDPPAEQGAQLVVARGPRRRHRDADAAAVVGHAGHPGGELGGAVTGVDEVAVAVDEAGDDGTPTDVHDPVGRGCLGCRPDPGDPAVGHDERSIRDDPEPVAGRGREVVGRRGAVRPGAGDELSDAGDEHGIGCRCAASVLAHHFRTAAIASVSSFPTSPARWAPSRTTCCPATTTSDTSAEVAA